MFVVAQICMDLRDTALVLPRNPEAACIERLGWARASAENLRQPRVGRREYRAVSVCIELLS